MSQVLHYCLYIDESHWDWEKGAKKGFQLAGFWTACPSGKRIDLTEKLSRNADSLLNEMKRSSGIPLDDPLHATETLQHLGAEKYLICCNHLLDNFPKSWNAVRIVNRTGYSTSEPSLDYTLMVAELYQSVLDSILSLKEGVDSNLKLHLVYASVRLKGDSDIPDDPIFVTKDDYLQRVKGEIVSHAFRNGKAAENSLRYMGEFIYESGARHPVLMICDWLSNSSQNQCAGDQDTFSKLDHILATTDLDPGLFTKRIRDLKKQSRWGEALNLLAQSEEFSRESVLPIVNELANLRPRDLDSQFKSLEAQWVLMVESQRDPGSLALLKRYENKIFPLFVENVNETQKTERENLLAPWRYSLHLYGLSAANHSGDVEVAHHHEKALQTLAPLLAGRWDHVSLLIEGMIRVGVQNTDRLSYEDAYKQMLQWSNFLSETGELFSAENDRFPKVIHSDLRGRVLGTAVQAAMYLGLNQPAFLTNARDHSDEAIEEFTSEQDRNQQYQYRCQLECYAQQFDKACSYLAKSLSIPASEPSTIQRLGQAIEELSNNRFSQGFALMHWFRIGAYARGIQPFIAEEILRELKNRKELRNNRWLRNEADFPAHSILRFAASLYAHEKDWAQVRQLVGRFRYLRGSNGKDRTKSFIFDLIWTATQIEVATIAQENGEMALAEELLISTKKEKPGAIPRIESILKDLSGFDYLNKFDEKLARLLETGKAAIQNPDDREKWSQLLAISKTVPW